MTYEEDLEALDDEREAREAELARRDRLEEFALAPDPDSPLEVANRSRVSGAAVRLTTRAGRSYVAPVSDLRIYPYVVLERFGPFPLCVVESIEEA